jgi:hypothetical protein
MRFSMRILALMILLLAGCRYRADIGGEDDDGDGYGALVDCDDSDDDVNPGATEEPYNGIDDDCDTDTPDDDVDGDGYNDADDCDDTNANINPGATEVCDGIDNDCSGTEDDALGGLWYDDNDSDGFGDDDTEETTCVPDSGLIDVGGDCDDSNADINPDAEEKCDATDWDCDGATDQNVPGAPVWYPDVDGDTYGDPDGVITACSQPTNYVADGTDCDDNATDGKAVNPGEDEICDQRDNDCDTEVDEGATDAGTWYLDHDGDGYGDASWPLTACDQPTDYVADATDCDDFDDTVNPAATEVCDGVRNDCDTGTDADVGASDRITWYPDVDGDGFGDEDADQEGTTVLKCEHPSSGTYVTNSDDCDDNDTNGQFAHPGRQEDCDDELDNDCDGTVDNAYDADLWYQDSDGDGYGDPDHYLWGCDAPQPGGETHPYVDNADDCNDDTVTMAVNPEDINPGETESCSGVDNDCNGLVDDGAPGSTTWYVDADEDGWGVAGRTVDACTKPADEYANQAGDCDDFDANYNPGATDTCDGNYDCSTYNDYDSDQDGFLDCTACGDPSGSNCPAQGLDCNDASASVKPGKGICGDGEESSGGESCLEVYETWKYATTDGWYTIDNPGGSGGVEVYCDMTDSEDRPGAGWTRVYKSDFSGDLSGCSTHPATPCNITGWQINVEGGGDAQATTAHLTTCGDPDYWTLLGGDDVISDGWFIGTISAGNVPHSDFHVDLRYVFVDDWEDSGGDEDRAALHLGVGRDGYILLWTMWGWVNHTDGTTGSDSCGGTNDDDWVFVRETFFSTGNTLYVYPEGEMSGAASGESFGFNDVEVWVR